MTYISEIQYEKNVLQSSVQHLNFFSELLEEGYELRLKVTGRSMSPFLKTGSVVTLSQVPVSTLRIGDIIFCRCEDGSYKLHRLIQIDKDMLITKGDALRAFDPPFDKSDYQGKVICIEQNHPDGAYQRNMESQPVRVVNYLIARYSQLKLCFICIYVRLKSKPA
ncbi:MAG: S24/S26 family peptidase [Desulfobacteraceae bacterium]|nr:S24/S26 family peptidase [Desulfobacteraceae bacterium]